MLLRRLQVNNNLFKKKDSYFLQLALIALEKSSNVNYFYNYRFYVSIEHNSHPNVIFEK